METTQTDKSEGAEVKHSPLPFAVGEPLTFHKREFIPVTTQIKIPGGSVDGEVCLCASPEDAAFIVRACNSHNKLVEALKHSESALDSILKLIPRQCDKMAEVQGAISSMFESRALLATQKKGAAS